MSLKIIYGKAGSGKTTACLKLIDTYLQQPDTQIVYIVPEHHSLWAEQVIVARYDDGSISRMNVLSFERMAQTVFSQVGPVGCDYIDDSAKQMLMQRAMNAVQRKLTVLLKPMKDTGFAKILVDAVSEFKKHNISVEALQQAADDCTDPMLKLKLTDIACLYRQYQQYISLPIADADDNMAVLCEKIQKHNLFHNAHILIDGFLNFTPDQLEVIRRLLCNARSVTVTLTTDSLSPEYDGVFQRETRLANQLFSIAVEENITILPNTFLPDCGKFQDNPELLHLEKNYFRYPPGVYEKETDHITLCIGNHYIGEVSLAAREILRLCREEGYRFRDIAVIAKDMAVYTPIIKSIFDEYSIYTHIDERVPVLKNRYIRALLSVFEVVIQRYSYESMFEWIKSDFCRIEQQDKYLLENYVLETGNTARRWTEDEDWTFLGSFQPWQLQRINQAKNIARQPVLHFAERFSGRKTAREIAEAYNAFLEEIQAEEVIRKKAQEFVKRGELQKADTLIQAYNCLVDTLSKLVLLLGEDYFSFEKFYAILTAGLEGSDAGQIPATVDQVQVTSVDRFQSNNTAVVFILGVTDGVFPCGYRVEGLLSDRDRDTLADMGVARLENSRLKHNAEEFLIYTSITAPTKKLYLCYPMADHDGKALRPSMIINRVQKLFPNVTVLDNIYDVKEQLSMVEGELPAFHEMLAQESSTLWGTVAEWYKKNRPRLYDIYVTAKEYSNQPLRLREENVALLYGGTMQSSISKAEQFARCHFAFFMRYGMRAQPRKENKIEPADAGTFMHEIIEKFSLYASEAGWDSIDQALCQEKCNEITQQVLDNSLSDGFTESDRNKYVYQKIKHIMGITLWNITQYYQDSRFRPLGYEIGFGGEGEYPPIEIPLENGETVQLTGKVDRADIWRTDNGAFLSIVDYKSSAKDLDFSQVLCGIQLQLPVYIQAVCESLSKQEGVVSIPAAMHYYAIDAPVLNKRGAKPEEIEKYIQKQLQMRGIALDTDLVQDGIGSIYLHKSTATPKQMDKLIQTAYKQLKKALETMKGGDITIHPARFSGKTACDYCPYGAVCGFDTNLPNNQYKNIRKLKREEFFAYAGEVD